MAIKYIQETFSKFARGVKQLLLVGGLAVLAACSSSSSDVDHTVAEIRAKQVAALDDTRVGLMESLARLYPNGKLPADQQIAASKLLMQNPSVFRSTPNSSNLKPQVFAGVTADFSPVYRIQNTTLYGSYFFTIYESEKATALSLNPNWRLEGPAFYASPAAATDLSPVYRFRNKINGSYVFSIYEAERNSINTSYADTFAEEGVAWYARQTPAEGFTELYRFRNKTNGTYLFTAYASEKQSIIDNYPEIFVFEGVAYYVQVTAVGAAYTGTVIDGYISGATVFWDCNGNRQFDTGEVFVTTKTGGRFLISDSPSATCELVAHVGIGAFDSDNPTVAITSPYTLLAVPSRPEIITPLTTMVAGVLKTDASMSFATAENKVIADFKLGASPFANYMPDSNGYNSNNKLVAKYIAQGLAQTTDTNTFTLNTVYNNVKSQAATPSFYTSLQAGYSPFVYNKTSILDYFKINIPAPNPNYIAILSDHTDTADNQAYMQVIADRLTADGNVGYGVPYYEAYDQATLKGWMQGIQSRKVGETNASVGSLIETFRADRQAKLFALGKTLEEITAYSPNIFAIYTVNGDATFNYILQSASSIVALEVDAIDLYYTQGKLNRITKKVGAFKREKYLEKTEKLKKAIEGLGIAVDSIGCINDATAYANSSVGAGRDTLKSCKDLTIGLIAGFDKLKRFETLSASVGTGIDGGLLATNDFSKLDSYKKTTEYWKHGLDSFDAIKDLLAMMELPPSSDRVIAGMDFARQIIGMYVNARELADAAIDVKEQAIIEYEKQTKLVFAEYYAKYISAHSWYFTVVDKTKDPYIKEVLPLQAALGQQVVFTIDGGNIPLSSNLNVTLGSTACSVGGSSNTARVLVSCTPSGVVTGNQKLSIKVGVNEIDGSPFLVAVNAATVTNITPTTATLNTATVFTVTGTNLPLTAILAVADATCLDPVSNATTGLSTGFTQTCTPLLAGVKSIIVKTSSGGTFIDTSRTVNVTTVPTPSTSLLTDTGITANQCYQTGSNTLVACSSAGAQALNIQQDGMIGRDVTTPDAADGKLGFSYSVVADPSGIPGLNYPKTACVKDNVTGLMWEGKTADNGYRDYRKTYTNLGNGEATDASGYVQAVNNAWLCGKNDWRLPTRTELQSLVDYSVASPGPAIDTTWFPNAVGNWYWTSSPLVGYPSVAWSVFFDYGYVSYYGSTSNYYVRLVR